MNIGWSPPENLGGLGVGAEGHGDHTFNDDTVKTKIAQTKHAVKTTEKKSRKETYTRKDGQNCMWQWGLPFKDTDDGPMQIIRTKHIARTASKATPPQCWPGCADDFDQETGSTYHKCIANCQ